LAKHSVNLLQGTGLGGKIKACRADAGVRLHRQLVGAPQTPSGADHVAV